MTIIPLIEGAGPDGSWFRVKDGYQERLESYNWRYEEACRMVEDIRESAQNAGYVSAVKVPTYNPPKPFGNHQAPAAFEFTPVRF